jgi:hypothetical protein
MFHYNADSTDGEIVVPTIKVIALNGLSFKRVVAARKSNMFIGVDLDGEEEQILFISSNRKVKIKIGYKYGVQIPF